MLSPSGTTTQCDQIKDDKESHCTWMTNFVLFMLPQRRRSGCDHCTEGAVTHSRCISTFWACSEWLLHLSTSKETIESFWQHLPLLPLFSLLSLTFPFGVHVWYCLLIWYSCFYQSGSSLSLLTSMFFQQSTLYGFCSGRLSSVYLWSDGRARWNLCAQSLSFDFILKSLCDLVWLPRGKTCSQSSYLNHPLPLWFQILLSCQGGGWRWWCETLQSVSALSWKCCTFTQQTEPSQYKCPNILLWCVVFTVFDSMQSWCDVCDLPHSFSPTPLIYHSVCGLYRKSHMITYEFWEVCLCLRASLCVSVMNVFSLAN